MAEGDLQKWSGAEPAITPQGGLFKRMLGSLHQSQGWPGLSQPCCRKFFAVLRKKERKKEREGGTQERQPIRLVIEPPPSLINPPMAVALRIG